MSIEGRYARQAIENLLREDRTFEPSPEFRAAALLNDASIYERTASEEGFRAFWTEEGNRLDWIEPDVSQPPVRALISLPRPGASASS